MQNFIFYLKEGWGHIIDLDALDHLLFLICLSAIYLIFNWKQVLILVTAFTIGHSLTLVFSVYNVIKANESWVEFLIPCTIIITALYNVLLRKYSVKLVGLNYGIALFFGLIHGLGYANTIRFMLAKDQSMGWSLFSFNVGLELGQIVVVAIVLFCNFIFVQKMGLPPKWWVIILSTLAFSVALKMSIERWPF